MSYWRPIRIFSDKFRPAEKEKTNKQEKNEFINISSVFSLCTSLSHVSIHKLRSKLNLKRFFCRANNCHLYTQANKMNQFRCHLLCSAQQTLFCQFDLLWRVIQPSFIALVYIHYAIIRDFFMFSQMTKTKKSHEGATRFIIHIEFIAESWY